MARYDNKWRDKEGKFCGTGKKEVSCKVCNKVFSAHLSAKRLFCSRGCYGKETSKRCKGIKTGLVPKTAFRRGHIPWIKGKHPWDNKKHPNLGKKLSKETKEKIRRARLKGETYLECLWCSQTFKRRRKKFCSRLCAGQYYSVQRRTKQECPQCKMIFYYLNCRPRICCSGKCAKKFFIKDRHPSWRSGIKKDRDCRKSYEGVQWRKAVFERDNFTCQICGIKGGYLEADHIFPYSIFPEKRFDVSNGRTLCRKCHKQTDTYGAKARKFQKLALRSQ